MQTHEVFRYILQNVCLLINIIVSLYVLTILKPKVYLIHDILLCLDGSLLLLDWLISMPATEL